MTTQYVTNAIIRRQSLSASVSRACQKCHAPGVYQNNESFAKNYPQVFKPLWAGRSVGPVCPCCGALRPETTDLGEIWSREWKLQGSFRRLVEKVKSLIKK
jgi:hypothetical protein